MAQLGVGTGGRVYWVLESWEVSMSSSVPQRTKAACIALQGVSTVCLWGREESVSLWGETSARGSPVGAVWKVVKLEMPAAE